MIDFNIQKIVPACSEFGLDLDKTATDRLTTYGNLLVSWNEKINLTAITEPEEVLYKHFYDCLLFFKNVDVPQNAKIIDVGTGAGFPGLVLKIARPDIKLTLLDGLNKRLVFLNTVLNELSLDAETVHLRAEEAGKKPEYREKFDIVTSRAVSNLRTLSEYCLPFVSVGGMFVSYKSGTIDDEISESGNAISTLGGKINRIERFTLPSTDYERSLVMIDKAENTPERFPRKAGTPLKKPL